MKRENMIAENIQKIVKEQSGNMFALYAYALCCDNVQEKIYYYEKAAELGNVMAMIEIGNAYYDGELGKQKDVEKAIIWYEKAAKLGNDRAMEYLGECYDNKEDYEKAIYWYEQGARLGNCNCINSMANLYSWYYEKKEEAFFMYLSASVKNYYAAWNVAISYENGEGIEKNLQIAKVFYKIAYSEAKESSEDDIEDTLSEIKREYFRCLLGEKIDQGYLVKLCESILKFYNSEDYNESCINMRYVLEYVVNLYCGMFDYQIPESLMDKVDYIYEMGCVDEETYNNMHTLRKFTNVAAHKDPQSRISKEEVISKSEVLCDIFDFLLLDKMIEKLTYIK